MTLFGRDAQYPARMAKAVLAIVLLTVAAASTRPLAHAQARNSPPRPSPDVILFTNGDQLSGILERGVGNSILFKSDMAGEITVPLDKVRELRSSGSFAVLRKDIPVSRKDVTPGTLFFGNGTLTVAAPTGPPETVPAKQIAYIIDQPTYDMELERKPGPLYGWNGSLNGGATIVRSTNNGSTYSAGIAFVRAIPAVPYLPARNRTTFNLREIYGKLSSPTIPQTSPPTPPSVARTSIFHTDAERDEYFSPQFFALAQTIFDHNYAQGLDLQQVYGAGIGWTAFKTAQQELDVKATLQFEKQAFQSHGNDKNLIGSTISEAFRRSLPRKLIFTESVNFLPAFNDIRAYSANSSVGLAIPLLRRLSLVLTSTDNFLNDPASGFKKNSFQFITAISYTLR